MNDIEYEQLIKIPSPKIISFTDFRRVFFLQFFFFEKSKIYTIFIVLCNCPFKKIKVPTSSLKCIYSCTIALAIDRRCLASEFMKEEKKGIAHHFDIKKKPLYRYEFKKKRIINNIKGEGG